MSSYNIQTNLDLSRKNKLQINMRFVSKVMILSEICCASSEKEVKKKALKLKCLKA
jgi:hypothetical protein